MNWNLTKIFQNVIPIVMAVEAQFGSRSGKEKKGRAVSGAMALLRLLGFPVRSETESLMNHAVDDVVEVLNHTGVFSRREKAKLNGKKKKKTG